MRDWALVAYSFGVVVRAVVALLLSSVVSSLLFALSPTPDPLSGTLLWLAVIVAALGIAPVRRRTVRWVVGTPPTPEVPATSRSE
jgi:hypothetical protein